MCKKKNNNKKKHHFITWLLPEGVWTLVNYTLIGMSDVHYVYVYYNICNLLQ